MVAFSDFVSMCKRLESTKKRLEMETIVADFLKRLPEEEIAPAIFFTIGRVFPDNDPRVLNVSFMRVYKILSSSGQAVLFSEPLTIKGVYGLFCQMAGIAGEGSSKKKQNVLRSLFSSASHEEGEYVKRILLGEMRHGVSEGVMLASIARASGVPSEKVRRANMLLGDIGETGRIALKHPDDIDVEPRFFVPIRPMLAESGQDFSAIIKEHGGRTALEFKFDGARIQVHRQGKRVRIYSRRLSDVTDSLPEVCDIALGLKSDEFMVEGEVIAFRERPLPFQELMRRFRRISDVEKEAIKVPVKLFLFDVLFKEGKTLLDCPNEKRWQILEAIFPKELLAERVIVSQESEAEAFFKKALEAGHEGLMAKDLNSSYQPGNRGKKWFKIKQAESIDCVLLAAEWGTGRRQGWLSNYHLGVYDEEKNACLLVGKTFKGLTDEEFSLITQRLLSIKKEENDYTVFVKPEIIVEVAFNEIQRSPHYESGFALRFARIVAFREDKKEPDTLARLSQMYERQFEKKDRL